MDTAASKEASPIYKAMVSADSWFHLLISLQRLKLEISSAHLRCHLLRGNRVSLVCSKSWIIAETSTAVGDNAVALLEAADLRADFDDRARK